MKNIIIFVVLIAGLGFGSYTLFFVLKKDPESDRLETIEEVRTVSAKIEDVKEEIVTSAEVRPIVETEVKAEINGRIIRILVEDGQKVERGQPLVELDRTQLQARLQEAERSSEAYKLRLEQAERAYQRLEVLRAEGFANEADFLDAKTRLDLAKIDLEIRETRLADARENYQRTTVVAPHDGIVIDLRINEGQVINGVSSNNSGTKLMSVADLTLMYLEANLGELEVSDVFLGKMVQVTFDSIEDLELDARVTQIAASAQRDRNRPVFPVRFTLSATDARVKPGISGEITVPVAEVSEAVTIPISCLFFDEDDEPFVYLKSESGFSEHDVEIGLKDMQRIEIKRGLDEGDMVSRARPPKDTMVEKSSEGEVS